MFIKGARSTKQKFLLLSDCRGCVLNNIVHVLWLKKNNNNNWLQKKVTSRGESLLWFLLGNLLNLLIIWASCLENMSDFAVLGLCLYFRINPICCFYHTISRKIVVEGASPDIQVTSVRQTQHSACNSLNEMERENINTKKL